jgi:hypothetical protein
MSTKIELRMVLFNFIADIPPFSPQDMPQVLICNLGLLERIFVAGLLPYRSYIQRLLKLLCQEMVNDHIDQISTLFV